MIYRESIVKNKPIEEVKDSYNANFTIYSSMAYFVAKELHIRPNVILDEWGVPELIVAYGYYANEISIKNYSEWSSLDAKTRAKQDRPEKFFVKFYSPERLNNA